MIQMNQDISSSRAALESSHPAPVTPPWPGAGDTSSLSSRGRWLLQPHHKTSSIGLQKKTIKQKEKPLPGHLQQLEVLQHLGGLGVTQTTILAGGPSGTGHHGGDPGTILGHPPTFHTPLLL